MPYINHSFGEELIKTARTIATPGKGILAADESTGTIGKRLSAIKLENTEENRRDYRSMLFRSPGLSDYISGVILYEETLFQKADDGSDVVDPLRDSGVLLGIKVDKGARPLQFFPGDTYTQGLTDLDVRAKKYYEAGARFCKWRAVLKIQNGQISEQSIQENAHTLARYAAICQVNGLCPIVEPEILMDGSHSIDVCEYWTTKVVSACYKALVDQNVLLEGSLLKPNMVLAGIDNSNFEGERKFNGVAEATVRALRRSVPPAVPGVTFLSGGQSEEEASLNLNAINKLGPHPWQLTFSYGRALQKSCIAAWNGKPENVKDAQDVFIARARANSEAQLGKYAGGVTGSNEDLFERGYVY